MLIDLEKICLLLRQEGKRTAIITVYDGSHEIIPDETLYLSMVYDREFHSESWNIVTPTHLEQEIIIKKKITCDRSIAPYILELNELGYETLSSCSGIDSDHYHTENKVLWVCFTPLSMNKIEPLAKELGFKCIETTISYEGLDKLEKLGLLIERGRKIKER